ncbi:barstar family protein [bacterium]|nr:barstar family protein [bacterium]MCI0617027.1 barstar family protein [bacterium]
MAKFSIDLHNIKDWESFHSVFASELKFFDGYGRNMDAWIDCMSDFHGENSLSGHHLSAGELIELEFEHTDDFAKRLPTILQELIQCTAFVNQRYRKWSNQEYIALIFR